MSTNDSLITDTQMGVNSDSIVLRYALPYKEFIASQQATIKNLETRLDSAESQYTACTVEVAKLNKEMAVSSNIYTFLISPSGLAICLLLGFIFYSISKRCNITISTKGISIVRASNSKSSSLESTEEAKKDENKS
jgi:hypothetical protein